MMNSGPLRRRVEFPRRDPGSVAILVDSSPGANPPTSGRRHFAVRKIAGETRPPPEAPCATGRRRPRTAKQTQAPAPTFCGPQNRRWDPTPPGTQCATRRRRPRSAKRTQTQAAIFCGPQKSPGGPDPSWQTGCHPTAATADCETSPGAGPGMLGMPHGTPPDRGGTSLVPGSGGIHSGDQAEYTERGQRAGRFASSCRS